MSISSSSNTTTSSSTSPESVIEHVAIVTSLILDKDKSIDDDDDDQTGAIEHSKLDHRDEHHYQAIKRTKVGDDDNDGDNNMQQANLMRCHNKNSSNYNNDLSSNELKSVPSIIRVSPLQKSQPVKSASQSPGVVQVPSQTPRSTSSGNNSTTFTTTIANATNSSSLLQEVASISGGSSSNNVSQTNLIKQSNTVVKIETSPTTTSDISPKKVAQTSKKSPPTRPDLVASSKLTLHADQPQPLGGSSKTRPLLMNYNHHNHYYQLQHNTNHLSAAAAAAAAAASTATTATAAAVINADGKNVSLYKYDANKSLATNVSSQLILSSIIAANPGQRATQQLGVGGNLTGLQFCLTAPSQQTTTVSKYTTSRNLIETHPTTITNATTIASKPSTTTTTTTTLSSSSTSAAAHADAIETKPSLDALQATARSKVKGYHLSGIGNDCSQVSSDNLTQSPGSSGGASGAAGNAVAARLIDLGKKLLEATKVGNVDQVRQLVVESGAPFTSDWLGTTALHIAAQNGFTEIAEILIRGGVNRDARTKLERTALHLAAQSGSLEIVDSLITRGADVNGCDMLKMTPLHWAVERGHVCVVERLLIGGADLKMKSKFQLTPVDMAKNSGFYDILELFKTWTSGCKDEENLEAYRSLDASFNESEDFLDIDYHLALVDSATNSRGDSMLDNDEPCLDLVGFEWNKFEIDPELFLPNEGEDDTKVEYLTKIVEELQRENQQLRQQLRQRVEQLNEKPVT